MSDAPQYFIAWNADKTEGFITQDRDEKAAQSHAMETWLKQTPLGRLVGTPS